MNEWFSNYLNSQQGSLVSIPLEQVEKMVRSFQLAQKENRQIFAFGNGGSAANASHFATELGNKGSGASGNFRVLSLTDNISFITAVSNDRSYEEVFSQQLKIHSRPGDYVLALSTSGNSPNVINAAQWAKKNKLVVLAMVGNVPCGLSRLADQLISISSDHCGRIEECHLTILHMISYFLIENFT